eukprot:Pgem_evm1s11619
MNRCNCEVRKRFRDFMADINSKSKCDLYKRVNSKKIDKKFCFNPDLIVINDISRLKFKLLSNTSGLKGERGRHRGSLVSRNCNCCNNDVSNNNNDNNNDGDDDDDGEDDDGADDDEDNLIRIEDTCHFLISCELYKEFREKFPSDIFNLKLGSFQEKWGSFDEKRRCI